jgi:hypothetical protein
MRNRLEGKGRSSMLFNSYEFVFLFLPVAIIVFELLVGRSVRLGLVWLLAASLLFYGWWDARFLVLLLGSVAFNYLAG